MSRVPAPGRDCCSSQTDLQGRSGRQTADCSQGPLTTWLWVVGWGNARCLTSSQGATGEPVQDVRPRQSFLGLAGLTRALLGAEAAPGPGRVPGGGRTGSRSWFCF